MGEGEDGIAVHSYRSFLFGGVHLVKVGARKVLEKSPPARANVRLPQRCPSPPKSNGEALLLPTTGEGSTPPRNEPREQTRPIETQSV